MNYQPLHVDRDHYYSVGIDKESGEYLMEVVITWIAWYSIYFRLLPEEVEAFKQDSDALRELSYELAKDRGNEKFKDRVVLNERPGR